MKKTSFLISAVLALCSMPSLAQETIKIGEMISLSGKEAVFGQSTHNGITLAFDEINAQGGVLGKKIEQIYEDDQSKAGQAATSVQKLIANDKVVALLGEVTSSRTLEAAPIAQKNRIPMITPTATSPEVTEKGDYVFRTCFTDAFQGKLLAEFALKSLKFKKFAMLVDSKSDYSVGLAKNFRQTILANGGQIVSERNYTSGDKDFRAQLTNIKASQPEAVFIPGYYTDVGLIIRQARQVGLRMPLFGGDGWEAPSTVQVAGSAIEGTYFSTHYSPEENRPLVKAFVEKYTKKFGSAPDALAALGYDAALIMADSIKRAGSTEPAKIRDAIAATKDFPGVTGNITIDQNRNASKPAVVLKATGGKFKYLETINPGTTSSP